MHRRFCLLSFVSGLIASVLLSPQASSAELETALAKIQAVGPQGAGAAEAATAWKTLSQSAASDLPTLLAAIDDEKPLAANYIRSAIEAIADREPDKLPVDRLEKFTLDTKNDPRARRLAYELLLSVEPKAESRLLPQMLSDPSVELRRDAVAQLLTQAEGANEKKVLQTAFSAAVDDDQVKDIAKRLKDLGEEVDIARHYGFIMNWHIVGPFDNAEEQGFDKSHGPEGEAIKLSETFKGSHDQGEVAWKEVASEDDYGRIDLNEELGKHKSAIAYAVATFDAEKAQPVELRYKSKNACKVWLNGQLIDQREVYHADGGPALDQYTALGTLQEGANTILLKVCQNDQEESWAQDWAFQLRVCDSAGAAVSSSNDN